MQNVKSAGSTPLRPPGLVMRLARLGSFHPSRLSFMRMLMRRMQGEGWHFSRPRFNLDERGVGTAVYAMATPARTYSLIGFGHDLPPEQRSDRVIAQAWDATFTLFDGLPDDADLARLQANVPRQEAGRISAKEICLSRANRSVRLFDHVVARLAAGLQPDPAQVEDVGYLMRTTAVYGSGKFGAVDREVIADRAELAAPFQAEMLTVFLIRAFVADLVEHLARALAPATAVPLEPMLRRTLGIGNSTGLGLAPFLINHPVLLNNWITARETALARIRDLDHADPAMIAALGYALDQAKANAAAWRSANPLQLAKIASLKDDLTMLAARVADGALAGSRPFDRLYRWSERHLSVEGQEQLVSLMLEPFGSLVDELSGRMSADEAAAFPIDGSMSIKRLQEIVSEVYDFALGVDWSLPDHQARVWYVSAEKLEPRLGQRFEEPIEPYEQPLAPGRDAALLHRDLQNWQGDATVAAFLLRHPKHRHIARRAQIAARYPYAEIRDNTICSNLLPLDLLRCKLAFFGAGHFDPRSDRWLRINMFRDAPYPHELGEQVDGGGTSRPQRSAA